MKASNTLKMPLACRTLLTGFMLVGMTIGCTVSEEPTSSKVTDSSVAVQNNTFPKAHPDGRVPYESEALCRETCGLSKVELSVKDYVVEPLIRITTSYPSDYLKTEGQDKKITSELEYEHNRLTNQKKALAGINEYVGNPKEINAVFYFERIGSESSNRWKVLRDKKYSDWAELESNAKITEALKERVLNTMVEVGIIKIIESQKSHTNVIEILKPDFEFFSKSKTENRLDLIIPLFDLKPVLDRALIYFPGNLLARKPYGHANTFYLREMVPKTEFSKQLAEKKYEGGKVYGRFSAYVTIYEWNGEIRGRPTLDDISSNKIGL